MDALGELIGQVTRYHPEADVGLLRRAFEFGERHHEGQKRKSGEAYFTHPIAVARIITELRLDSASLCAALLHDTVEDTRATIEDVQREFGEEVAFLVDGVTKLSKFNFTSKEDAQAENFRKMLLHMASDIRVLLVKLADRLDNMRTLDHMKPEAQERIARETLDIYAPLANRLGIAWMKSELEDLGFKHTNPDGYKQVSGKLTALVQQRDGYIHRTQALLSERFAEAGFATEVSGRVKHLYSIWRKMQQSKSEFEQVWDVIAFRAVVESAADCYAVLGVVHSLFTPIPGRFKDYIALPKPNGYQSLHTTVLGPDRERMEVQLRTRDMHGIAEQGIAAHWKYKERPKNVAGHAIDHKDAQRFHWLRQLMEWQQELRDPQEFLESVKVDLFQDEVYVFTPRGEIKVFPRTATPVDFAYAVHTNVGSKCTGARVNGQIVPLRYHLRSGDVVEIMTDPNRHPNKDWLEFTVTSRARSKIRGYLRSEQRESALKLGRDLLERALHAAGLSFAKVLKTNALGRALEDAKLQSVDELIIQVGYGRYSADAVVRSLMPPESLPPPDIKQGTMERVMRKVTGRDSNGILVDGENNILVRFAKCCSPLPGDQIVGYISRGRGISVHRRSCTKGLDIDPERRVTVSWDEGAKMSRPVCLRVITANRPGLLAEVGNTFSKCGVNIEEANCRAAEEERAVNLFTFTITDLGSLKGVMRALQKVKGVLSVERV